MAEFKSNAANFQETGNSIFDEIENIIAEGGTAVTTVVNEKVSTGKWGMSKLWRSWVGSCSKFMAANGATMPLVVDKNGVIMGKRLFNADDGHELFTIKMLGQDNQGKRLSWAKKSHGGMIAADQGQRLHAMTQLHEWATERGIRLYNPRDSEYLELIDRQCD